VASIEAEGQVELADLGELADSPYANPELLPVPVAKRTWSLYNYAALWIGMSHNLVTYTLAASLIAAGMNPVQALITIALGNLIVLIPMLLNSHAGTKYGIPFPVFARAFYGIRGANLAALLRALVACGSASRPGSAARASASWPESCSAPGGSTPRRCSVSLGRCGSPSRSSG
jgi:nucleobase:cation symporter-1, NCS1 family